MTEYGRTGVSRVAVTGGTGFIGSRLVERLLAEGYTVRVLSRHKLAPAPVSEEVEVFHGDLLDTKTDLGGFLDGVDALFHCAGEVADEARMQALNVDAVSRLLEAARGRKLHWVQLSSVGVYGARREGMVTEDTPMTPMNVYERSKADADELLTTMTADDLMTWSVLRPANIYGEGMPARGLHRMVDAVRRGFFRPIGDGKSTVHYIHIDNVVDALLLCLQDARAVGRIYNFSDTNSILDCVGIIAKFYGKRPKTSSIPEWLVRVVARLSIIVPGLPINTATVDALVGKVDYSRSRIENELGYNLRIPIGKGLNMFLTWKERERGGLLVERKK